jgi:hypothetical protein
MLKHGGSMVTRISPDLQDFSVVIEKMSSHNSDCARGWNPQGPAPDSETVLLKLQGAFLKAVKRSGINVWYSNLNSGNSVGDNPPDAQLMQRLEMLFVGDDAILRITVHPEELYTLTTLQNGGKGDAKSPEATPFPIPFMQNFEEETVSKPPRLWYDQMGAFEVQKSPYNDAHVHGKVMRQVVPVWPQCWGYSCTGPSTYFGPSEMKGDLAILFDVRFEDEAELKVDFLDVLPTNVRYHAMRLDSQGMFTVGNDTSHPASRGPVKFATDKWHRVSIRNNPAWQTLRVDGRLLTNVSLESPLSGEAACDKKKFPEKLSAADENEVMGVLGLSPGPDWAMDEESCRNACCEAGDKCYLYLFSTHTWHSKCLIGKTMSSGYHIKFTLSRYIYASFDNFHVKPGPDELIPEQDVTTFDAKLWDSRASSISAFMFLGTWLAIFLHSLLHR